MAWLAGHSPAYRRLKVALSSAAERSFCFAPGRASSVSWSSAGKVWLCNARACPTNGNLGELGELGELKEKRKVQEGIFWQNFYLTAENDIWFNFLDKFLEFEVPLFFTLGPRVVGDLSDLGDLGAERMRQRGGGREGEPLLAELNTHFLAVNYCQSRIPIS